MVIGAAKADTLDSSALAEISGSVTGNTVSVTGPVTSTNSLNGGYDGATGVSVVQQNNGDNNMISAAVSVADLSETVPVLSISTSALVSTTVSGNSTSFDGGQAIMSNVISGAFNGASGVMVVQQNNGHNNAISAAVSVSATGGLGGLALDP